jgi:hypothetical protein
LSETYAIAGAPLEGTSGKGSRFGFAHVALLTAVGLAVVSAVDGLSRATLDPPTAVYWLGVALIVAPAVVRMLAYDVRTGERVGLILMFGLALFAVKLMRDPFAFTLADEFPHVYNAQQVLIHHHLYTANSFLPVTADFPGLAGATSAIAQLSGMSPFGSGMLLLAAARTTFMLGLFVLLTAVGGDRRAAGLGTLVYAADSNFMLWQAQYAYESLALPLFVVLLACVVERSDRSKEQRWPWGIALVLLIAAIVPTHHLTSYAVIVTLLILSIRKLPRLPLTNDSSAFPFAILALVLALFWLVVVASVTVGYISPVVWQAIKSVYQTITREAPPHALFGKATNQAVPGNTLYEQALGGLSVLLSVLAVWFSLKPAWLQNRRPDAAKMMLVAAAALYIPVMGMRFAGGAWETSVRLVDFLSIGVAFVVGWFPLERLTAGWLRPAFARLAAAVAVAIMVVGGAINGWSPASRISRATQILADGRRLESPSFAVGAWMRHEPPGKVVGPEADAEPILVFGHHPVASGAKLAADEVLQMASLPSWALPFWRSADVHYIVVDRRADSTSETDGFYFGTTAKGGYPERLLPVSLATRFDDAGLSRIYDSGNIFVYALRAGR